MSAERFIMAEARVLERRLYETCVLGAPPDGVVAALRAYRNGDGGFGYGLEPDKRAPDSLPLDVEIAFRTLADAGVTAADPDTAGLIGPACDFLAGVADERGAVSLAAPVIERYPRAGHLTEWTYEPGVNPTAGLAGLLYRLGFDHPWRDAATAYVWAELDAGTLPDDAHALSEVLVFLEHVPDRDRADRHADRVGELLRKTAMFHLEPGTPGYGMTPLQIAPEPGSRWRTLFTDEQLGGHLDKLVADQQDDGGWPISWDPPSTAARLEWRGMVTVGAVRTLAAYGRSPARP
ncbi:hypothetical protein [Nucisporomicrobium flavum]|uniref:hypothetical protein n=1 Tax=Nucisporomicrobium flavum TaxID=2785915 RepID=UPI0018F43B7E|nr:hypothetical protein [Nucisporomicrobium flavum]